MACEYGVVNKGADDRINETAVNGEIRVIINIQPYLFVLILF